MKTRSEIDEMNYPTPTERETTINASDGDSLVTIYTHQRHYIAKLRANPKFTETRSGTFDGCEFAEFTIPASQWNPATGAKRTITLTDEQRQKAADQARRNFSKGSAA